MEQPEQQVEFGAVVLAFRSGDRMEAQRLFDAWYQRRTRETDTDGSSATRLVLSVETIEIYAAGGEKDAFMLEYPTIEEALESDTTIPDDVRAELAGRLARAWQEVM